LRAEPLIETDDPSIRLLSQRLRRGESNPRAVAERLAQWVHDSIRKEPTPGAPSAVQVLERKAGDCNEHTLLFMALARAQGIPTRAVSGLVHVGGRFYYHAWPEIWLRRWIPIDPTLGQFPADASHIRLLVGGLQVQAELLRIIDAMDVEVIDSSERVATMARREHQPS